MGDQKNRIVKGGRLGTQFRGKLTLAYGQRGKYGSNLWYVYSPRTKRDWVLHSNLEYDHFVLTEADPTVRSVNYAPDPITIKSDEGDTRTTIFDAEVIRQDGSTEWREVKSLYDTTSRNLRQRETQTIAASIAGVTYCRYTEEQLHTNSVLLENLRRVLAWVSAARDRSLASYYLEVAATLDARRSIVLGELYALGNERDYPLYLAAVMQGVLDGRLISDIATHTLSKATLVSCLQGTA
ncbi:PDDEXK family nuclease [Noviherbaspirillum aerium]|uniref:hypothetical protein n=1 Tax=Noviherbaspirillum aerium TaxID=2588497 RepID=UPI00124F1C1B|nr:hypothetical protein [Noviherbaspirillum aerium]